MSKERTALMIKQILDNPNIDNKYIERELIYFEREVREQAIKEERERVINKIIDEINNNPFGFYVFNNDANQGFFNDNLLIRWLKELLGDVK